MRGQSYWISSSFNVRISGAYRQDPKKYSDRHKLYLNYQKSFQMWFFKYYHHIIIIEGTNSDDKEMDLYIQLSIKKGGGDRLNQEKQ